MRFVEEPVVTRCHRVSRFATRFGGSFGGKIGIIGRRRLVLKGRGAILVFSRHSRVSGIACDLVATCLFFHR